MPRSTSSRIPGALDTASTSVAQACCVPPDRLIFIDESGCNIAMSPTYGRAPRGQRVIDHRPTNWGKNISIVGAVRADRVLAHQTMKAPASGTAQWLRPRSLAAIREQETIPALPRRHGVHANQIYK